MGCRAGPTWGGMYGVSPDGSPDPAGVGEVEPEGEEPVEVLAELEDEVTSELAESEDEVPEDMEDAMAWLEELAAGQGAPMEELPSLSLQRARRRIQRQKLVLTIHPAVRRHPAQELAALTDREVAGVDGDPGVEIRPRR